MPSKQRHAASSAARQQQERTPHPARHRSPCRNGQLDIRIENAVFDVHEYNEFMKSVAGKPGHDRAGCRGLPAHHGGTLASDFHY